MICKSRFVYVHRHGLLTFLLWQTTGRIANRIQHRTIAPFDFKVENETLRTIIICQRHLHGYKIQRVAPLNGLVSSNQRLACVFSKKIALTWSLTSWREQIVDLGYTFIASFFERPMLMLHLCFSSNSLIISARRLTTSSLRWLGTRIRLLSCSSLGVPTSISYKLILSTTKLWKWALAGLPLTWMTDKSERSPLRKLLKSLAVAWMSLLIMRQRLKLNVLVLPWVPSGCHLQFKVWKCQLPLIVPKVKKNFSSPTCRDWYVSERPFFVLSAPNKSSFRSSILMSLESFTRLTCSFLSSARAPSRKWLRSHLALVT